MKLNVKLFLCALKKGSRKYMLAMGKKVILLTESSNMSAKISLKIYLEDNIMSAKWRYRTYLPVYLGI